MEKQKDNIKTISAIPGYQSWIREYLNQGLPENEITAYFSSAWAFRAIQLRANAITEANLCLISKNGKKIEKHKALDVIENSLWDTASLWSDTESSLLIFGNGYWEKARNSNGTVRKLFYMNPLHVMPEITSNGITKFIYSPINGSTVSFIPNDVVFFRGPYNPNNDLLGYSPMKLAIQSSLGEKNADIFMNAYFKNGATPTTVVMDENPMPPDSEINRIRAVWDKLFKGNSNQHKTAFLFNGQKVQNIGSNMKDVALSEVRTEMHRTICTALGVPELLIAAVAATDITPVEMAYKIFYSQTVLPQYKMYANVLNQQLLPEFPDLLSSGAYFEFDTSNIVALNAEEKLTADKLVMLVEKGILKPEVAAIELGYKPSDVPEKEEPKVEEKLQEVVTGTAMSEDVEETAVDYKSMEMGRWERKAIKSLKDGKSPAVKFQSEILTNTEIERITNLLTDCTTVNEVKAVFSKQSNTDVVQDLVEATLQLAYEYRNRNSE